MRYTSGSMPDIVTKELNGEHDLKTFPVAREIESGKVFCYQIRQAEFFPDRVEFEQEPCALGRIKMYFCFMQEI